MSALCEDCRAARDRWVHESGNVLAYLRQPGVRITEFSSYDGTPAGIEDRRRATADGYYSLVRRQVALIEEICGHNHQLAPGIDPLPSPAPGDQLDLFGVAT